MSAGANDAGGGATLPGLDARPGFDEPWQAELLAIAQQLVERGMFSAGEWSEALGAERRRDAESGRPDDQRSYYEAALRALEVLTLRAGALTEATIDRRQEQWHRAYEATPHGDPVLLEAGGEE
jgi:nitrile hydratase accessory protein